MPTHSAVARPHARFVTREDLKQLARFSDGHAHAVSFYFSLASTPDNSHHHEAITIKRLIHESKAHFAPGAEPSSLAADLAEVHNVAEEVRANPKRFRAILACHKKEIWREFDLPAPHSISRVDVGRRFVLFPLLAAAQSSATYCIVLLESGKVRTFIARGTEIQEIAGRLPVEDLSLHAQDSRVGWSKHIDKEVEEHERAYFRKLAHGINEFMAEQRIHHLAVGCREDLWGEIKSPFAILQPGALLGHFHLHNFAMSAADVLHAAAPIFQEAQKQRVIGLLHEINESSTRAAIGVGDVLRSISEGRVLKLVLGKLPNQTISECRDCGAMWTEAGSNCVSCGSVSSCYVAAEEGLIRQALLTDAEIIAVEPEMAPGFGGVAALLRY